MHKRCLTLTETLIAMVLVLALGALVFPSLMNALDERAFEAAADETSDQLIRARAHAQATGSPVEVTYSAAKSQVRARVFSAGSPGSSGDRSEFIANPVHESWALRELGKRLRIVARPPAGASESAGEGDEASIPNQLDPSEFETWEELGKGQDVRLAVFMPDGSALMADRVWLNDDKGRVGVFSINPWSGLPIFQRLSDISAKAMVQEQKR